jgi:hypothetical protein
VGCKGFIGSEPTTESANASVTLYVGEDYSKVKAWKRDVMTTDRTYCYNTWN